MQDLPDTVIEVIVEAIGNGHLIQKQARLCDLAALDAIPTAIVRRLKLHHQQAIALSPVTSPKILSHLACSEYEKVRLAVKKNPQRSTKIEIEYIKNPERLRLLSKNEDWRIRAKVASNLSTPVDVLEVLAYDTFNNVRGGDAPIVRSAAARNPATPIEILETLSQDSSKSVRNSVASNPSTPIFILENLATSFAYAVAGNPSTPSYILKNLAISTNEIMQLEQIAKHKNTPTETLTELSTRNVRGWQTRLLTAVAQNPNTSVKTLEEIYLYSLQEESDNLKYLKKRWTKNYFKQQLINIRKAIAENPNSPISLLEKLEEEMESYILIGLAQKPNLPMHLIRTLAEDYEDNNAVQECLAKNYNIPIEILQKLAQRRNNYIRKAALKSLCQKIGENPAISTQKLREILNYQESEVRHAVAKHPQGLKLLLDYCLKPERNFPEQNSLHRVLTGMYPKISREQMDNVVDSEDFLDRLAVVCNPNISKDNLEKLTEDENFVVRQTAVQFLLEKQN